MAFEPIGVITRDATGEVIAQALAARGRRVLLHTGGTRGETALARGIERVATPTDIAAECSVVLMLIESTDDVRELLLGAVDKAGLGVEMMPGAVLVDLGVRPPRETQSFLGLVGMRGVGVVDAAVIGSQPAISGGAALILAGGFPDAVEMALPALSALGRIERTGPLGSAHTAAALMGYMEAAHLVARDEALTVGAAFGLHGATLARVLDGDGTAAAADSNVLQLKRRTELARRLAEDRGITADIIDLTRLRFDQRGPGGA